MLAADDVQNIHQSGDGPGRALSQIAVNPPLHAVRANYPKYTLRYFSKTLHSAYAFTFQPLYLLAIVNAPPARPRRRNNPRPGINPRHPALDAETEPVFV